MIPVVIACAHVPERDQILGEPTDGVVFIDVIGDDVETNREAALDARWAIAQAARERGLVPFAYPIGTRGGHDVFFDGRLAALRFVKPPFDRKHLFTEITHRLS